MTVPCDFPQFKVILPLFEMLYHESASRSEGLSAATADCGYIPALMQSLVIQCRKTQSAVQDRLQIRGAGSDDSDIEFETISGMD